MTDRLLQGIHHVAIRVKDFDASLAFYTQGLGLTPTMRWGEGDTRAAMLDAGNGDSVEIFAGGGDGPLPEGAWLHLAFTSDDPDAAFARALAAGAAEMHAPFSHVIPTEPPTPVRLAFVRGLDGEVIEFFKRG
ncbi:MAG TPA: VOC family protein [Armatimonadota bacterium]|nr:VOC family protein [Armatimonadota bacterium]HOS42432.1 VOC family protein [Armatimonadota bacterium]